VSPVAIERPNVSDVNPDGLQDTEAPTPEYLARQALARAREQGEHLSIDHLAELVGHLRTVRRAEH
jgi:hypothetical protein